MERLSRCAGALAVMCLCGMVLVLAATLVLRPFGVLVPSSEIITTFLMVGMAFLGMVYAYTEKVHVRVDALYRRLPRTLRHWTDILVCSGATILCASIAFYSWRLTALAYRFDDLSDGLIAIPMWIPLGVVPLGFGLFALALLRDTLRVLQGRPVQFSRKDEDDAMALAAAKPEDGGRQ